MYLPGGDECRSNGSLSALEKVNSVLKPVACSGNTFLSEVAERGYSRTTFRCNVTVSSLQVCLTCWIRAYVYVYEPQRVFQRLWKTAKVKWKNIGIVQVRCTFNHAWAVNFI